MPLQRLPTQIPTTRQNYLHRNNKRQCSDNSGSVTSEKSYFSIIDLAACDPECRPRTGHQGKSLFSRSFSPRFFSWNSHTCFCSISFELNARCSAAARSGRASGGRSSRRRRQVVAAAGGEADISAAYVLRVTRRYILTSLVCPIRWQRAWACTSFWGFQSLSYMMTVSAAVKLMPTPPARVEARKTKQPALALNLSMAIWRTAPRCRPSKR